MYPQNNKLSRNFGAAGGARGGASANERVVVSLIQYIATLVDTKGMLGHNDLIRKFDKYIRRERKIVIPSVYILNKSFVA